MRQFREVSFGESHHGVESGVAESPHVTPETRRFFVSNMLAPDLDNGTGQRQRRNAGKIVPNGQYNIDPLFDRIMPQLQGDERQFSYIAQPVGSPLPREADACEVKIGVVKHRLAQWFDR